MKVSRRQLFCFVLLFSLLFSCLYFFLYNRHPKYKTDFCKTFHSKGFCPYGPRCHFIHDLNENFIEQQQQQQQLTSEAEATVASIQKSLRANKLNTAALKAAQKFQSTADIDKKLQEIQSQLTSTLLSNMDDADLLKDQQQFYIVCEYFLINLKSLKFF